MVVHSKILLVVDIQKEIKTKGRPYFIENLSESISNAKILLEHARKQGWPVCHVQHLQDGDLYGYKSPLSKFIDGFEPQAGEEVFTKNNYSCFASAEFTETMEQNKDCEIILIGYGTTRCVLATIIEGYHRGFKFTLVTDATGAQGVGSANAKSMHHYATTILSVFCTTVETNLLLA